MYWPWRWQTLESLRPDWSEPVWQCVPPALSLAARKGMRAALLPRCTVTGVVAVVSVPRVLGVPAAQPAAAQRGWVRTSFGVDRCSGLSNLISPVQIFGRL